MTVIICDEEYLVGYKEIGVYLGVSVRTAKRYAREGMPVLRERGRTQSVVRITKSALDAWWEKRIKK